MTKVFSKKLAICWFTLQFAYFAVTMDINSTGTLLY